MHVDLSELYLNINSIHMIYNSVFKNDYSSCWATLLLGFLMLGVLNAFKPDMSLPIESHAKALPLKDLKNQVEHGGGAHGVACTPHHEEDCCNNVGLFQIAPVHTNVASVLCDHGLWHQQV